MKLSNHKILSARISATLKLVFGIPFTPILGLFAMVYLSLGLEDGSFFNAAIVCFVLMGLCIWMIIRGAKQKKLISACERYAALIVGNSITRIEHLAASLGQPIGTVRKNLEKMINLGFLQNIYLDNSTGELVFQTPEEYLSYQPTITVECQSCGGKTAVCIGQHGVCDYCGSPIFGK
jgi:hypothetical protein